ncbi:MAG TPA: glycosyltransferase [Gemmatimonadales bacterium]|nr:glycosyltransferase [Gemmatimonadales bacterium]
MPVHRVVVISHVYLDPARRGKLHALAARDVDVTVGVPHRSIDPALHRAVEARWERQGGIETFPIAARRYTSVETLRFGRRELRALLRDKRPDLVQIEEEPETGVAAQIARGARRAGIPAVLFLERNLERSSSWRAHLRRNATLDRVRGVITGGAAAAELLRQERPGLPITVIPQLGVAVATNPEHAYHEGLAIGYIGRLVPEKGLDTLLHALAENRAERWHLTVAGEGPEREGLEHLAGELRLSARIRWMGALPSDRVSHLWPDLDVLVLPSRATREWREPTGQALMEAMAHEVAVVGTASGVIPEIIGESGIVVPPNDPGALAAALRAMADQTRRQPLARAARARVMERFSDDAIAERTIRFWGEVLS